MTTRRAFLIGSAAVATAAVLPALPATRKPIMSPVARVSWPHLTTPNELRALYGYRLEDVLSKRLHMTVAQRIQPAKLQLKEHSND